MSEALETFSDLKALDLFFFDPKPKLLVLKTRDDWIYCESLSLGPLNLEMLEAKVESS